jgi:hypothetical protein
MVLIFGSPEVRKVSRLSAFVREFKETFVRQSPIKAVAVEEVIDS